MHCMTPDENAWSSSKNKELRDHVSKIHDL